MFGAGISVGTSGIGPQGAIGSQGDSSAAGAQGSQGSQGSQGILGAVGTAGAAGVAGSAGNQGFQGNQGAQGSQGAQGAQGAASGPPVAGYTSWYDASDTATITSSGGNVTQWNDKGSSARNMTPEATGPSTGSRTINGLNALYFPGSSCILNTASHTRAQPLTYFLVVDSDVVADSSAINASIIRDTVGTQPCIIIYSTGGVSRKWGTWAGSAVCQSTTAMDNSPHVVTSIFNGASSALYLDGALENSSNPGTSGYTSTFSVGSSGPFDGAVGEIIVYESALGTTDREAVEAYLAAKWGTP